MTGAYLAMIPWSVRHYRALERAWNDSLASGEPAPPTDAEI